MAGAKIIAGGKHADQRGKVYFNNEFDASLVKRMYIIENADMNTIRAWQGHRVEQRWFAAVNGSFKIELIQIDDWGNPSKGMQAETFTLDAAQLDILHIPSGYVSSIRALEDNARLLVMADTFLGEKNDEYRFPADYFKR